MSTLCPRVSLFLVLLVVSPSSSSSSSSFPFLFPLLHRVVSSLVHLPRRVAPPLLLPRRAVSHTSSLSSSLYPAPLRRQALPQRLFPPASWSARWCHWVPLGWLIVVVRVGVRYGGVVLGSSFASGSLRQRCAVLIVVHFDGVWGMGCHRCRVVL